MPGNPNDGINEDYLNDIAGLEPDANGDDTSAREQSTQEQGDGTVVDPNKPATGKDQQVEGKQPKAKPEKQPVVAKDGTQQQQQQDGQTAKQLQKHVSGNFVDDKGNIVTATGQVVAAQGSHRRLFEENGRIKTRLNDADNQIRTLRLETEGNKLLNGIPAQYGLDQQDVAAALDLAGRMKRGDALGVAKEVIALLVAQGHNVTELLGKDVGDSIDMKALNLMLDRRLAPIQQREQQETQRTEQMNVAQRNYNEFVSINEYAEVHGNEIAALAKQDGIPLQLAYNRLIQFAHDNGFDPSLPLGPQIEAKQAATAPNNGKQQQQQTRPNGGRPMPNGANTRDVGVRQANASYADPNATWSDIIKNAMAADKQTVN